MTHRESRIHGALAGRDLCRSEVITDLVDVIDEEELDVRTERLTRTVAQPIAKGAPIYVHADGQLYPTPEETPAP